MQLDEKARKQVVEQAKRRGDLFSLHLYTPRIGGTQGTQALTRLVAVAKEAPAPAPEAYAELLPAELAEDLRLETMSCELNEELHRLFEEGEVLHMCSRLQYMDLKERMRRLFVGGKMKAGKEMAVDPNNPWLHFTTILVCLLGVYALMHLLASAKFGRISPLGNLAFLAACVLIAAGATLAMGRASGYAGRFFYQQGGEAEKLDSLARSMLAKHQYDKAISLYEENYRLYGKPRALFSAADVCYLHAKRPLQALEFYERVIAAAEQVKGEERAFALLKKGEILLETGGDKEEARASLQAVIGEHAASQHAAGARAILERIS